MKLLLKFTRFFPEEEFGRPLRPLLFMTAIAKIFVEPLLAIAVGIAIGTPLLLLNVKIAPKLGLFDWPKARGVAEERIPLVGYSLVAISLAYFAFASHYFHLSSWFITTSVIVAVMGHFDDRRPLPPLDKMFFQLVCVITVVLFDPNIHASLLSKYGPWGTFWAIFFILGLTNAINFIDGIDGLAGVVLLSGALGFTLYHYNNPSFYPQVIFASLMVGMFVPFLYLNVVQRKGFLGNVGSYFFAYVLALIHLSVPMEAKDPVSRLSISGLCFIVPIADAAMVLIARLITRRSPFQADKGHLHHRLVQTGIPLRYVLLTFGVIQICGVATGVMLHELGGAPLTLLPAVLCTAFVCISTLLILLVEKASKRRVQTFFQHLDQGESLFFFKYRIRKEDGSLLEPHHLERLEARIISEIRISDLCYHEKPETIFIAVKTVQEPVKIIANRLDFIFQSEKVKANLVVEQGEFVKVPHVQSRTNVQRMFS